ncbi:MAG: hypothetical protein ACE5FO_04035 [Parvularculaceae bacterium]
MSAATLTLERFDAAGGNKTDPAAAGAQAESVFMQRARAESYSEGFAAGQAAAEAETGEENKFLAAVCAAVETELAEIPVRVNRQMGDAFKLILEKIFPRLAQSVFAEEAAKAFAAIQLEAGDAAMNVSVSPAWAERLESEIEKLAPEGAIKVTADPELDGAAARAVWPGGGVEFDMDRAIAECLSKLETAVQSIENGNKS